MKLFLGHALPINAKILLFIYFALKHQIEQKITR
jgi:hypothetical protein